MANCAILGCDRDVYAKHFCNAHYQRDRYLAKKGVKSETSFHLWLGLMHESFARSRVRPDGKFYDCSFHGCFKPVYAKGMCQSHYIKKRKEINKRKE